KWTYWMQSLSRHPELSRSLSSTVEIQAPDHPTPLSYYSVTMGLQENDRGIELPDDPHMVPVELRATDNEALNLYLTMIELRLKANETPEARKLIDRVRYEALETKASDGLKLYLGFLAYQTQSGLQTFRFLSPLVRDSGPFANMGVLRLLYPLWHFES